MIYTDNVKLAMKIAHDSHHGQVDKGGTPYIYHPIHLAEQLNTEDEIIVALLHDVVEDTDATLEDLKNYGFNEKVIEAINLMSHNEHPTNEEYKDYILKLKSNPIARAVKIEDLKHNTDHSRAKNYPEEKVAFRLEMLKLLEED